jgi:hypothetical protein
MKAGYWDSKGFHEGVMPAVDFGPARLETVWSIGNPDLTPCPQWFKDHARNAAQADRLDAMCDPHSSIVNPDGTVGAVNIGPTPWWDSRPESSPASRPCTHPGCNQIDGKPCAFRACPNQTHTPLLAPIADASGQERIGPQSVTGLPRGGCESPAQASRHSVESEAAWIARELGDVPVTSGPVQQADAGVSPQPEWMPWLDPATVGDDQRRWVRPRGLVSTPLFDIMGNRLA